MSQNSSENGISEEVPRVVNRRVGRIRNKKDVPVEVLPNGMKVFAYNEKGQQVCNSRLSSDRNKRCRSPIVFHPVGRCEKHGGKINPLNAEGNRKTPKFLEYMPKDMLPRLERFLNDPDILSLREDIAITNVTISELLEGLGSVSEYTLKKTEEKADDVLDYISYIDLTDEEIDQEVAYKLMSNLANSVKKLALKQRTGSEIKAAQDHKRKLVEAEHRMTIQATAQIPAEKAFALVLLLVKTIAEHSRDYIEDAQIRSRYLKAVSRSVSELVPLPGVEHNYKERKLPSPQEEVIDLDFEIQSPEKIDI